MPPSSISKAPSHHMSMLVVCVTVPNSSSGARYLCTEIA